MHIVGQKLRILFLVKSENSTNAALLISFKKFCNCEFLPSSLPTATFKLCVRIYRGGVTGHGQVGVERQFTESNGCLSVGQWGERGDRGG